MNAMVTIIIETKNVLRMQYSSWVGGLGTRTAATSMGSTIKIFSESTNLVLLGVNVGLKVLSLPVAIKEIEFSNIIISCFLASVKIIQFFKQCCKCQSLNLKNKRT